MVDGRTLEAFVLIFVHTLDRIFAVGEMEQTLQLDLKGIPKQESSLDEISLAKIKEFYTVSKSEGGLILQAVAPELLKVSRTRLNQLQQEYAGTRYFLRWQFFGKYWFSKKELLAFSKIDRSSGRGRPSLAKIVRITREELPE